jgi:hypothetical protein
MPFEAIKPAHCAFTDLCSALKNFVAFDAFVVTNGNFGGINKGNTRTFAETDGVRKEHHRYKNTMLYCHKPVIKQTLGEIIFQMHANIMQITVLEIFETSEMEKQ